MHNACRVWILGCLGCAREPVDRPDSGSDPVPVDRPVLAQEPAPPGTNLLLVVLDDVGRDKVGVYGDHPNPAPTPRLDALAASGRLFRNAYALSLCSPTRAALLTGRYPSRTGVGSLVEAESELDHLGPEDTLPEMLSRSPERPYTSALVGKWHLGQVKPPNLDHPGESGFASWAGSLENLGVVSADDGLVHDFYHWEKNTGGTLAWVDRYAPTDTTDDAIAQLRTLPEPWFLYVAYNGAHAPWHVPPAHLHSQDIADDDPIPDRMDAMVEAVDTELGRLLDALGPLRRARTTIVVLSDNGSPREVIREPWPAAREKGTVYEASVRVPLVIAGPLVSEPGETDALVHVVDLFPTAAALAGVDLDDGIVRDGRSLLPILADASAPGHDVLFSEKFPENGSPHYRTFTLRDADWKLVSKPGLPDALYDLHADPWSEGDDLFALGPLDPAPAAAFDRLRTAGEALLDTFH